MACFNIENNPGIDLSDELIRIDIMVQADGHVELYGSGRVTSGSHYRYEMHFAKERKIERCRQLLNAANIAFKERVNPNDSTTTITFALPESIGINKNITKYYMATPHQLEIVAEECLKWDGVEGYRSNYSNTDKTSIDVIQFAFSAIGVRAGIYQLPITNPSYARSYQVIPTRNPTVGYTIKPVKVKSEDGYKYCFTTDTGYFVARRNGHLFITGNCGVIVSELSKKPDTKKLQDAIEKYVPYGREVHEKDYFGGNIPDLFKERYRRIKSLLLELRCYRYLKDARRLALSIGSLGGGEVKKRLPPGYIKDIHCKTRPYREKL